MTQRNKQVQKKSSPKIDKKQKDIMVQSILRDYPDLQKDSLQLHYIENMVESYLLNPDDFNRKTTEIMKKEKKVAVETKKMPDEIVSISKIEGTEKQCLEIVDKIDSDE